MKNEEEQHKFVAKRTSDKEVKSKTVKSSIRVSTCGPQSMQPRTRALAMIFCGPQGPSCGSKVGRRFHDLLIVIYSF
jgi:hypothetical protein